MTTDHIIVAELCSRKTYALSRIEKIESCVDSTQFSIWGNCFYQKKMSCSQLILCMEGDTCELERTVGVASKVV